MMKLLVCFKIVPDLDQLTSNDFDIKDKMNIDLSFVKTTLNCFDESGLEFGLRLSDEAEGLNLHIEKSAITVGNEQTEVYLKTLQALRYDNTVRIDNKNKDIRFQPDAIGAALSEYLMEYQPDVIIMGRQSPEGNNFSTPQVVAEQMGIPLIPNVVDMHMVDANQLRIITDVDSNLYEQMVKPPLLVTIGNAVISKLRVPTLKDRMIYGKKEIEHRSMPEYDSRWFGNLTSLELVDRSRSGVVIEAEGSQAVDELYERYLKERLDYI